ncbi:hypothetical protein [Nocardia suismassiliense]|uniref:hypothetical protein n=1 Tax=Nocardia suismassiliense TaxID=2077092 RepID=UPI000D1FBD43|nr:hypothetical protein [Nocardia suismassiliense]
MDILTIGRGPSVVAAGLELIRAQGFTAHGVTADADALAALEAGPIGLLLIGGGVESDSSAALQEKAAQHGVPVIEAVRNGRDLETYLQEEVFPILRARQ